MAPLHYLVIDEDGALHHRTAPVYTDALDEVGPEGWNRIQLTRTVAGFVNDVALVSSTYTRNVTGGLVLMAFGSPQIPYAGPIVFTGWDPTATRMGRTEVTTLTPLTSAMIIAAHALISEVLSDTTHAPNDLVTEVLNLGEMVSVGQAPTMTALIR